MNGIFILLFLSASVSGVRKSITQPSNVWPGSTAGIDLSGMHASNAPRPVQVWATQSGVSSVPFTKTDKSAWVECPNGKCECDGYLRYGSNSTQMFSAPIVAHKATLECGLSSVRSFLWSDVSHSDIPSTCQCRHSPSLNIVLRGKCLSQGDGGWIGPGLINCTESMDLVSEWKYHPVSGQIRTVLSNSTIAVGGSPSTLCLSAVPYSTVLSANFSSNWNAWGIKLLPCSSSVHPFTRQAWDLPGELAESKISMESVFGQTKSLHGPAVGSQPAASPGRIRLRHSSDIGNRCLDIAVNPPSVPTKIPTVWLEAIICDDIRFTDRDFANFEFFLAKTKLLRPALDHPQVGQWTSCANADCSDCENEEIRGIFTHSKKISEPVSFSKIFSGVCNMEKIREIAVPSSLVSKTSSCFCQSIMSNHFVGPSLIAANTDDLPSTLRPQFPLKKVVK